MKILKEKSITDITGFKAIGIHCGAKKSGKKDLGIIYSQKPAIASGAMTQNMAMAAPVIVSKKHMESETMKAIVVNSGNANACTGVQGEKDAYKMAEVTAKGFGISPEEVLVASTGVIGVPMPMDVILPGIETACKSVSKEGGDSAAEAMMTTDTFIKKMTVEIMIDNKPILISGIAKGSGMIHPNMATMLSFIVTDANISKELLDQTFKESVKDSYNMVSVDGDTSTNDMAIILANGEAGNAPIEKKEDLKIFKEALDYVNQELAKMIAKDGEGATKFIEVSLLHGKSQEDARTFAKAVISSSLVKAAFFGSDANWGRIMCALGYAKAELKPEKVDIYFENEKGKIQIAQDGAGLDFDEVKAKEIMDQPHSKLIIDLKDGVYSATAWGCDLTYDYVKINGSYRS